MRNSVKSLANSTVGKVAGATAALAMPLVALGAMRDGSRQSADLAQLVTASAEKIAGMPSLKTISVYTSGGSCKESSQRNIDYFSKRFNEQISVTKPALKICSEVL